MPSDLVGRWTLIKSEKWEDYMKAVGVGIVLRKIAANVSSQEDIKEDETGEWTIDITSTIKNIHLRFKPGVEFDETTADGRQAKATFDLVDGTLRETQKVTKGGSVDSVISRKVQDDGTMLCTLEAVGKDVTCYRTYSRVTN